MSSFRAFCRTMLIGSGILCAGTLRAAPPLESMHSGGAPVVSKKEAAPAQASADTNLPPAAIMGPFLPEDRAEIARQAQALCSALHSGQLRLTNPARETEQLTCLMQSGAYYWPVAKPAAPANRATLPSRQGSPSRRALPDTAALPDRAGDPFGLEDATESLAPTTVASQPSPGLLRMLTALAAHANASHPLELMSLLRPPYQTARFQHAGPRNPHSLGLAADIAMYEGVRIRQDRPEDCVRMTLALLRDLPPGRYRFGMPKSPEVPGRVGMLQLPPGLIDLILKLTPADAVPPFPTPSPDLDVRGTLPSRGQTGIPSALPALTPEAIQPGVYGAALGAYAGRSGKPWPFFPPPELETENGVVAPLREKGRIVLDSNRMPVPHILRFRNESYAAEEDLIDPRLRDALTAARKRGVDVIALFPDAADHVHVDVKQER